MPTSYRQSGAPLERDEFSHLCRDLTRRVIAVIAARGSVQDVIDTCTYPAFVKAADGVILQSNAVYRQLFDGENPVGRMSHAFLDDSLYPVAMKSDALILAGCTEAEFIHSAQNRQGNTVAFWTYKSSLIGAGHPTMAILGVTHATGDAGDYRRITRLDLARAWETFESLSARDKEIAGWIARGERPKIIAEHFGVTEKTIENRRSVILKTLALPQPTDLIKLLVRLQDSGFRDFGL